MSLNILPTGEPSPQYECTAIGECGTEKTVVLTEWWSDHKKVEDIKESAMNYFYDEAGFDKAPFKITSIRKIGSWSINMSSDFYIKYQDLLDKELVSDLTVVTDSWVDYDGAVEERKYTVIQFIGYDHFREVELDKESGNLQLSCGGPFRNWLINHLDENNITYEMI